jgi:hypothetical protein
VPSSSTKVIAPYITFSIYYITNGQQPNLNIVVFDAPDDGLLHKYNIMLTQAL